MAEATSDDSFTVNQLVFAAKRGYIAWLAKLISRTNQPYNVQFLFTNDLNVVPQGKIWPYNKETKIEFITKQTMEYEEFRSAISIAEDLLERATQQILKVQLRDTLHSQDLALVCQLRLQRSSLYVEPNFVDQVNLLCHSLTIYKQDYLTAQMAFQELLEMRISALLLLRNKEAVKSIRLLCGFVNPAAENPNEPLMMQEMAKHLYRRCRDQFEKPFSQARFWTVFCKQTDIYRSVALYIHYLAQVEQS